MDSEIIQEFNKALTSMCETKPPISKQKIVDITKAAMNAVRYFKHVIFIIEKFLAKCRNEYKLSGLYVIDSIVRQAKKQYQHKDVFAPRFAINLQNTFTNVLTCDQNDRLKAVRVVNLWAANNIFEENVIEALLQYCRASGLEVDMQKVEVCVKGDKANMNLYGIENKNSTTKTPKTPPQEFKPKTPPINLGPQTPLSKPDSQENQSLKPPLEEEVLENRISERDVSLLAESGEFNQLTNLVRTNPQIVKKIQNLINERIQERIEIDRRRKGNIQNLLSREFDYSDEEDEEDEEKRVKNEKIQPLPREQIITIAKSLLSTDNGLAQELQQIQQQNLTSQNLPTSTASTIPSMMGGNLPPDVGNFLGMLPPNFSVPPPNGQMFFPSMGVPPPSGALPPGFPPPFQPTSNASNSKSNITTQDSRFPSQPDNNHSNESTYRNHDRDSRKFERSRSPERDSRNRRSGDPRIKHDRERERNDRDDRDRGDYERDRGDKSRVGDRRGGGASNSDRKRRTRSPDSYNGHRNKIERADKDKHKEDREKEKIREEKEKDKERERKKNGFPTRPKPDHVLIASRTLWFGRIPGNCSEADICESIKEAGVPERVNIVAPRGCAYVTMKDRRAAFKIMDRLAKDLQVSRKVVKLSWATFQGLKENENLMDYWDSARGIALIPFNKLPEKLNSLLENAFLDVDTLPNNLKEIYKDQNTISSMSSEKVAGTPSSSTTTTTGGENRLSQQNILSNIPDPNMFKTPNAALLNIGNMFQFPQHSNAPFNALNTTPNSALPTNLAPFFPHGFPNQFIQPPNLLAQTSSNSNPFAAPADSSAAVVGGGREPILPPTQSAANFPQQNFRPQFQRGSGNFVPRGRGTRFPPRGFDHRGGGQRGQFMPPRGGERGGRGNWNPNRNFPQTGGFFRGDSGATRGFRGRGTNFGEFPQRFAPPPHGNNNNNEGQMAFVPKFSQAMDVPDGGRGFRKFGRPDAADERPPREIADKIPGTNLELASTPTESLPKASKERRSRFSDLQSVSSDAPPGTEDTTKSEFLPPSNIISEIPQISPSFEQRLNATFPGFNTTAESVPAEKILSTPQTNYFKEQTPINTNLPSANINSSTKQQLVHKNFEDSLVSTTNIEPTNLNSQVSALKESDEVTSTTTHYEDVYPPKNITTLESKITSEPSMVTETTKSIAEHMDTSEVAE